MNRFVKPIQVIIFLALIVALTGCNLGQAAEPTPTAVDVNAIKTAAAATAFVQLTEIAAQASPTPAPTETQAVTNTPEVTPTTGTVPTEAVAATVQPIDTPIITLESTPTVPILPVATATQASVIGAPTNVGPTCKNSAFMGDVTIPDGTVLKPGAKFTKIWSVKNTGTCTWDEGFGIVLWAGPDLNGTNDYFSGGEEVAPGGVVDMAINMRAPWTAGEYIAHWVMVDDTGKAFGTDLVVYIKVQQ